MNVNDILTSDDRELTIEPYDARWMAKCRIYSTSTLVTAKGTSPNDALEKLAKTLNETPSIKTR